MPVTAISTLTPGMETSNMRGITKVMEPKTKPPAATTIANAKSARYQPGAKPTRAFSRAVACGGRTRPERTKPI